MVWPTFLVLAESPYCVSMATIVLGHAHVAFCPNLKNNKLISCNRPQSFYHIDNDVNIISSCETKCHLIKN